MTVPLLEWALPPVAVETRGHLAAEMCQRHGPLGNVGRLEYRKVAAALVAAVDDAQHPAVALGGIGATRHEDRLATAVGRICRPGGVPAALQIVVSDAVEARLVALGVDDVARHDPAMAIVAHAEAFVGTRELAGGVGEP